MQGVIHIYKTTPAYEDGGGATGPFGRRSAHNQGQDRPWRLCTLSGEG